MEIFEITVLNKKECRVFTTDIPCNDEEHAKRLFWLTHDENLFSISRVKPKHTLRLYSDAELQEMADGLLKCSKDYGVCETCGQYGKLMSTNFHYDIDCTCHGGYHVATVKHCATCKPKEPIEITVKLATKDMIQVDPVSDSVDSTETVYTHRPCVGHILETPKSTDESMLRDYLEMEEMFANPVALSEYRKTSVLMGTPLNLRYFEMVDSMNYSATVNYHKTGSVLDVNGSARIKDVMTQTMKDVVVSRMTTKLPINEENVKWRYTLDS